MTKKYLSKTLIVIFSFLDQFDCIKMQALCKDAYYIYFPKILKTFFLERQYVHLYLPNTKSFLVTYLDNYRGREVTLKSQGFLDKIPSRLQYFASV